MYSQWIKYPHLPAVGLIYLLMTLGTGAPEEAKDTIITYNEQF